MIAKNIFKLAILLFSMVLVSNAAGSGCFGSCTNSCTKTQSLPFNPVFPGIKIVSYGDHSVQVETSDGRKVDLKSGDVLLYSSSPKDPIGNFIRDAQEDNGRDNPYGVSHAGYFVVETPNDIKMILTEILDNLGNSESDNKRRPALENALKLVNRIIDTEGGGDKPFPFTVESNSSVKEIIIDRVRPGVHLYSFPNRAYDGNVRVRPLNESIPLNKIGEFLTETFGKPYTSLLNMHPLIDSVNALNENDSYNTAKDATNQFCSQLAASLYKATGIVQTDVNPANIPPERLCSASKKDFLEGVAGKEIALQEIYAFKDKGESCPMKAMCDCVKCCNRCLAKKTSQTQQYFTNGEQQNGAFEDVPRVVMEKLEQQEQQK